MPRVDNTIKGRSATLGGLSSFKAVALDLPADKAAAFEEALLPSKWLPSESWKSGGRVRVLCNVNDKTTWKSVDCVTYSGMAVHRSANSQTEFWYTTIAHVGLITAWFTTKEDAQQLAETLWDGYYRALRLPNGDAIRAALPDWVKPWVKAMQVKNVYLDPTPYMESS